MTSKRTTPEEELSTVKTIGRILEVLALPILIIVAVLLNLENKNLGIIGLLLGSGSCMFILGLILSHLPQAPVSAE